MNRIIRNLVLIVSTLCFIIFLFSGCASTGQNYNASTDEMANIDELLGLDNSGDDTLGGDEVLQMLGIAEEAAMDSEFQELNQMGVSGNSGLNSDMKQLETQQNQLDAQTQNLQSKVAQQENQIAALENTSTPSGRTGSGVSDSPFSQQYQDALQTYRSRQYRLAIQKFDGLLAQSGRNSLSDNAQYWIGESYYGLGDFQKAIASFEKVFTFNNSNKDDAAQLKLGLCYMQLKDNAKAREELQKLINNYPTSESVGLAKRLLNQIQTAP